MRAKKKKKKKNKNNNNNNSDDNNNKKIKILHNHSFLKDKSKVWGDF